MIDFRREKGPGEFRQNRREIGSLFLVHNGGGGKVSIVGKADDGEGVVRLAFCET